MAAGCEVRVMEILVVRRPGVGCIAWLGSVVDEHLATPATKMPVVSIHDQSVISGESQTERKGDRRRYRLAGMRCESGGTGSCHLAARQNSRAAPAESPPTNPPVKA